MIKVLSKETIDKIAAGEVVERPESVVKELLDNAIDSGATAINVEIRDGGIALIRVTDNGCGIRHEEISTAFLRHATSKLNSAEDLYRINTMGFRGEALASICGVAQVEMITKRKEELLGSRYRIEGGIEKEIEEIGAPDGTTIIVRNLFYNVPVRKSFLKTKVTETAYVSNVCEKIALSHPDISLRLVSDGRLLLHTIGNGNIKDVIYTVYGRDIIRECIELDSEYAGGIKVQGYIGKPIIARAKRDFEVFYVNGRHINSDIIRKAVEDAYEPFMMQHRFPFALIMLNISPETVDVNVHPKKSEVRFSDSKLIYDAVKAVIKDALLGDIVIAEPKLEELKKTAHNEAKEFQLKEAKYTEVKDSAVKPHIKEKTEPDILKAEPFEIKKQEKNKQEKFGKPYSFSESNPESDVLKENESKVYAKNLENEKKEQLSLKLPFFSNEHVPYFKLIGQVFDTYWIIEYEDSLYLIDQHAAHEKVNYEKLLNSVKNGSITSQQIYPPVVLSLSLREEELFEKYFSAFEKLGYEIEKTSDRDYFIRAVPAMLPELKDSELIKELIDGLDEERGMQTSDSLLDKLASMSCKQAIKGNRRVDRIEMEALIKELLKLENPYNCPHGRPTIIKWTKKELDKMFKRII
ncbi:MAG: DNA mismatch repair endonuclease MutL [Eubacteriales bacterium]|nr:DNA mismatch repair endonuclease MutL [Eubacteriales bacterium]